MPNRIAIIGSRTFTDYHKFEAECDYYLQNTEYPVIISGGAIGSDSMAKRYAEQKNYQYIEYLPQYDLYDKRAPLVRNIKIIESCDAVIAFHNGTSKGTLHALGEAKKRGVPIRIVSV